MVEGLLWTRKIVDDILIWAPDLSTLHSRIKEVSTRCQSLNVILSKKKFVIGDKLPFAGYIVFSEGINSNQECVEAIRKFPVPKDTSGVKSFIGLDNQLNFFIPDFSHQTKNMRVILGKGMIFHWLPEHTAEFDRVKTILSDKLLTRHFNPDLPVQLLTDASRHHGLGLCPVSTG